MAATTLQPSKLISALLADDHTFEGDDEGTRWGCLHSKSATTAQTQS